MPFWDLDRLAIVDTDAIWQDSIDWGRITMTRP